MFGVHSFEASLSGVLVFIPDLRYGKICNTRRSRNAPDQFIRSFRTMHLSFYCQCSAIHNHHGMFYSDPVLVSQDPTIIPYNRTPKPWTYYRIFCDR